MKIIDQAYWNIIFWGCLNWNLYFNKPFSRFVGVSHDYNLWSYVWLGTKSQAISPRARRGVGCCQQESLEKVLCNGQHVNWAFKDEQTEQRERQGRRAGLEISWEPKTLEEYTKKRDLGLPLMMWQGEELEPKKGRVNEACFKSGDPKPVVFTGGQCLPLGGILEMCCSNFG